MSDLTPEEEKRRERGWDRLKVILIILVLILIGLAWGGVIKTDNTNTPCTQGIEIGEGCN